MSEREEMRRLIDVIERGVMSASVEQNVEDLKLFANTASFIANKLEVKLKQKKSKPKARQIAPSVPKLPLPKPPTSKNKPTPTTATTEPVPPASGGIATSSTDVQRLRGANMPSLANPNAKVGTIG